MENNGRLCCEEWRPAMSMIVVDVALGVMNLLIKTSLDQGLNCLAFITVRQLIATVFMAPVAFFKERKSRPKLTGWIFLQLFLSAMLGASLTQYLFFIGLQHTTAPIACAFLNMAPVFTFLLALPFGLETVNLRSTAGRAKTVATAICISGAMVLMFYKGMLIPAINSHSQPPVVNIHPTSSTNKGAMNWIVGSLFLLAGTFCYSAWFLVQSKIGKSYPALYSSTTIMFFLSFLQAGAITLVSQPGGISQWTLNRKIEIITVVYSGVICSGMGFLLMSWCVGKRGPVFTAAFTPLIQAMVIILDYFFLREPLHIGSVIGSVLVIFGLYFLLWAKSKETNESSVVQPLEDQKGEGNCQIEQV